MTTTTEVPTITVTNAPGDAPHAGRTFVAAIVPTGGRYGRNAVLVNDDGPMVEFYDATHADNPGFSDMQVNGRTVGQFASRYFVATLQGRDGFGTRHARPLNLDGGVPVWTVDGDAMIEVMDWLDGLYPEGN